MSELLDRPSRDRSDVTAADLLPLLTAAVRAVLLVLVPLLVAAVVGWIAAVRSTSSMAAVVRVGADVWLLGQGSPLAVVGTTPVSVVPLGVTVLSVLAGRRAVRFWVRDQRENERGVPFWRGVGTFAGAYGVLALLVALLSRSSVAAPSPLAALAGGAVVGGLGAAAGAWAHRGGLPAALPPWVAAALRPAVSATAVLVALGSLAVLAALAVHHDDVLLLHRALEPGLLGGVLLTAGQALLLPTLAVWALAWISGAGFAVGVGTSVAPGGTSLATLPTIPVLGALPTPGVNPVAALAVVLLPVLVGAGVTLLETRRTPRTDGLLHRCGTAVLTAAGAGVLVLLLAAAASGAAGSGRMADLGPAPVLTALAVAGEVAAGGLLAVLIARGVRRLRGQTVDVRLPPGAAGRSFLGGDRPERGGE
ncbi:cell division protein PerM [Kineococcus rubinsiae]|uniref:cell division protein PerM n=1 Tax=Kineococcus rubinsiae TaxID=2609562 RepID=UPI00142FA5B3|nr:DUF6350 family protein [Kineococcus rubinsiae]NIZ91964.1 hypothetical protein [Kineococcus rubinsiae]